MTNWDDTYKKFLYLQNKRSRLEGQSQSLEQERLKLLDQANKAQERIQASDMVKELLERLQRKEHERAVGAYEQLLGAFVSDVLPGERQIVMDLHTDRGAPALDMYIKKGENSPMEDAWLGTGGSVTNLLSTGLRVIALLRSGQRKFLVLDESDCWIKPDLIPRYAQIVSQMSNDLGVQVLMISHHDESLFSNHIPHRLKMTQLKSGMLTSEWSTNSSIPVWDEKQTGLRSITLKNFQSHEHTMINLSPQVTLLQGDNDIGKSAVVNALRAVFDGDSNDTMIKHHQKSTNVTFDLGPEHILMWSRFKKGKVKVSYKLTDKDDQSTIHESDGTKIPDWVQEQVKIGKIEGLDVQIGQQQDPVFLLNRPPSQRAKALAIGQESGHVNTMMSFDKNEVQEAKSLFKNSERMLERIRQQMYVLELMGDNKNDTFNNTRQESFDRNKTESLCTSILEKWKRADQKLIIMHDLPKTKEIKIPTMESTKARDLFRNWVICESRNDILKTLDHKKLVPLPVIKSQKYRDLKDRWDFFIEEHKILDEIKNVQMPKSPPSLKSIEVESLAKRWKNKRDILNILSDLRDVQIKLPSLNIDKLSQLQNNIKNWKDGQDEIMQSEISMIDVSKQINQINMQIEEKFPFCPTCERVWDHKH